MICSNSSVSNLLNFNEIFVLFLPVNLFPKCYIIYLMNSSRAGLLYRTSLAIFVMKSCRRALIAAVNSQTFLHDLALGIMKFVL